MNGSVHFELNKASVAQIAEHLSRCDADFVPPLSERVNVPEYAKKIASNAIRFEAWSEGDLVGLVAAYCNDGENRIAYITSVSVLREWTGNGIASNLVLRCVEYVKAARMRQISLEVASDNASAIWLYGKNGFTADKSDAALVGMSIHFEGEESERKS